jgi:hypothetical protein
VIWTILKRTVPISAYQLRALTGNMVPFNFRPPQKLYSRKVIANFQPEQHEGAGEEEGEGSHHSSASSDHIKLVQVLLLLFVSMVPSLQ